MGALMGHHGAISSPSDNRRYIALHKNVKGPVFAMQKYGLRVLNGMA
jgi:hypothetical protein